MKKTGVLLVNLGTPKSPSTKDVRIYLTEFLNDPYVIDIPWLKRKLLVNLVIVPFRAPKSAAIYKEVWTDEGSPLLVHSKALRTKLQGTLGDGYQVELAMRYQEPSLKSILSKFRKDEVSNIIVIPLFPQYATSTTESIIQKITKIANGREGLPPVKFVKQFYNHPQFIQSWVERAGNYTTSDYDHVIFSFHGLPERQLNKLHGTGTCDDYNCIDEVNEQNQYCYKATCYETARSIAKAIGLNKSNYTISFQSRLGKDPWIQPFSDCVIANLGKCGMKKLLVFSPAFVADCLETNYEIAIEYNELFKQNGGEKIQLVDSLNDNDSWVETLKSIVLENE